MARIYRQTYSKPLPADAQIVQRKGRRFARFKDGRGRSQEAPLSANGKLIIRQATKWYIEYRDAEGVPRKVAGYTDKQATEQKAAELERRAAHAQTGLIDRYAEHRKRPLLEHVEDWKNALLAKGNTEKHAKLLNSRALKVMEACRFTFWADISGSRVQSYFGELRSDDFSLQTCNFYLQAVKQFCRWMVQDCRAPESPVAHLQGGNVRMDRRHDRRAFADDELRLLLDYAGNGPVRYGMPGADRAMLYWLAVETGLRAAEIRSLNWRAFSFDATPPSVSVMAAYAKNRREDALPLRPSMVAALQSWCESGGPHASDAPVFRLPHLSNLARMLRADLDAARAKWIDDAKNDAEKKRRDESDVLKYTDGSGRVADFHALRHTFITNLARGGVAPKVAQDLARHSDINLTLSRYTHTIVADRAKALDALPDLEPRSSSEPVGEATKQAG